MTPLLEVKQLEVAFFTKNGIVRAVNGISYNLEQGDTLGIVGESGSGKSVSLLATLGLIPMPPGKIMGGEVLFDGKDLLKLHQNQWVVSGAIYRDDLSGASPPPNPVMTIGDQIDEATMVNLGLGSKGSVSAHR